MKEETDRPCLEIFETAPKGSDFVRRCTTADRDGECQQHSVSKYSPGPVQDGEIVARWVSNPPHGREGSTTNFSIGENLFDDAFRIGGSSQRVGDSWAIVARDVHQGGYDSAKRRSSPSINRTYLGVVHLSVAELRSYQLPGSPVRSRARVYDTALLESSIHADIMVYQDDLKQLAKKDERRLLKQIKIDLLSKAVSGGLFLSPWLDKDDPRLTNLIEAEGITIRQDGGNPLSSMDKNVPVKKDRSTAVKRIKHMIARVAKFLVGHTS